MEVKLDGWSHRCDVERVSSAWEVCMHRAEQSKARVKATLHSSEIAPRRSVSVSEVCCETVSQAPVLQAGINSDGSINPKDIKSK